MGNVVFTDNSMKVKAKLNDITIAWLHEVAGEVTAQTKRNSRKDSGDTRNAWTYTVDESKGIATVGNPKENAIWEELGTGEYAYEKNGRKGAWYVPVEKVTGTKKPTYYGQVIVVYGKDGQAYYKTNGKQPKRMLFNAFAKIAPKAKAKLESMLGGMSDE